MQRGIKWAGVAIGIVATAAGWFLYERADSRMASAATYRRELAATQDIIANDGSVLSLLPMTVSRQREIVDDTAASLGVQADISNEGDGVTIRLRDTSHRMLVGFVQTLKKSGVRVSRIVLRPDASAGKYIVAKIVVGEDRDGNE